MYGAYNNKLQPVGIVFGYINSTDVFTISKLMYTQQSKPID